MKLRRRKLECDYLETRALLSGAPGHLGGHHHAQIAMSGPRHGAAPAAEVETAGSVTGGGLLSVSPAPDSGDVAMMQQAGGDTELVLFLTQFEVLSGSNPATQQTAASLLNDGRNVELALNAFAGSVAVTLPPNVTGNNQVLAQQMVAGYRAGTTDQTYSSLIVQAETSLVAVFQQMATGAQDPAIRTFAAGILPTVQADLAAAQGTGTLAPVSNVASSTTLSSSDLSTLETYYSIDAMEHFLGQLTGMVMTRSGIVQYSTKLIVDHEGANITLGSYAATTATYLPAAISPGDAPMAMTIIAALHSAKPVNSVSYDRVYLNNMVMGHTAALQFTHTVIATTQNPVLRQFAANIALTIYIHRMAANTLLRGLG